MPSRHTRNARNKQHAHIQQQPTPSSRPSPDIYPSSLPAEDSANSSSDEVAGHTVADIGAKMRQMERFDRDEQDEHEEEVQEIDNRLAQGEVVSEVAEPLLVDIAPEEYIERPVSLPTPPLPELSDIPSLRQPQPAAPLSPLWDDSGNSTGHVRSPILSSLASHGSYKSRNHLGDALSRISRDSGPSSSSSSPARQPVMTGAQSPPHVAHPRTRTDSPGDRSIESADYSQHVRAPTASSDRTADLNDLTLDLQSQHMEGTIRPSRRASSSYGYGFPHEDVVTGGDTAGYGGPSAGHSRGTSYEQTTVRSSGLSRAMAHPESGRQSQSHPIPQYEHVSGAGRTRPPLMTIPASINGAPDEGDTIVWAKWDQGFNGRRLLFLSYYPLGMQIWDCTDLGSISEVLNLSSESVRQLIADDSVSAPQKVSEETPEMVVEYAGIIPQQGSSHLGTDEEGPFMGILISPTDDKRDRVDEASESVLLTAEDEIPQDSSDNHSFLILYSLAAHAVIERVRLPGLCVGGGRFEIGDGFVVVSTTQPPSLHVLSSTTFDVLHTISSSDLMPFCHKPSSHGLSSSHLSSRRHSFLETTSNLVNDIYNNYNDRFNDNYNNTGISARNNVSLPTVDHFSPSSTTGGYPGGQASDYSRQRRVSTHAQSSQANERPSIPEPTPLPAPIFSVSGRLLAYASMPEGDASSPSLSGMQLRTSSTLSSAAVSTASAFGSTLSAQLANLGGTGGASGALGALGGISQADVGNAALKVGGSMLSGMKSLGGLAYKSAVAAASEARSNAPTQRSVSGGGVGALANRFFSRSAPAATSSSTERDRRYSVSSMGSTGIDGYDVGRTFSTGQETDTSANRRLSVPPRTVPVAESGYHVTVLDLASLVSAAPASQGVEKAKTAPAPIMQFVASKSQPVASIWFSPSGASLLIAPRDGQTIQVYDIKVNPLQRMTEVKEEPIISEGQSKRNSISSRSSSSTASNVPDVSPVHVYNLRRGRTPGVIESADWASDGRWIAFGTRKRTVHLFAVNPYGGSSDVRSHMEGKVSNYAELPSMPTDLHPLVRLRVSKNPTPEQPRVPLVFAFLEPSIEAEGHLPPNLLPAISSPHLAPTHQHSYGSVNSNHTVMSSSPSARSEPISPRHQFSPNGRSRNYQDVLVFDPTDGVLSLRRVTAEIKPKSREGPSILGASFGSVGGGSTSRSLPGMGPTGRLSVSASPNMTSLHGRVAAAGNTQASDTPSELIGREGVVALWSLRRGKDWAEVKRTPHASRRGIVGGKGVTRQANWLAQAELSTSSKSPRVLPRSIYLSHQFSFHSLGEDYHALIRRYQFDLAGSKIEVRKGVEISAYPTGNSESFVEGGGFAIHRDRRSLSSSFDEPLASALAGGLDYAPSQPVLPMLPNGTPGSKPRTFKNSIPIRTMSGLGDGMTEGIGRFRREIKKVRSPPLHPSSDAGLTESVPLEFDEEDEDFMSREPQQPRSEESSLPVSPGAGPQSHLPPMNAADDVFISEDQAMNDDQWPGWVGEDRKAVDEVETFDDISAVGFLDEEQEAMIQAAKLPPASKKSKSKKKK